MPPILTAISLSIKIATAIWRGMARYGPVAAEKLGDAVEWALDEWERYKDDPQP